MLLLLSNFRLLLNIYLKKPITKLKTIFFLLKHAVKDRTGDFRGIYREIQWFTVGNRGVQERDRELQCHTGDVYRD